MRVPSGLPTTLEVSCFVCARKRTHLLTFPFYLGLGVLFTKLQQGVQENEQILTVARMRAEAEDTYGQKLGDIEAATNKIEGGFQRDDGASVKKVWTSGRNALEGTDNG